MPRAWQAIFLFAALSLLCVSELMSSEAGDVFRPSQPRAGVSGVLKGKPFHAKFEIAGTPLSSDSVWVAEIFRNRVGSLRTEMSDHRFGWISDVRTQRLIILDHDSKMALISPVKLGSSSDSPPRWGFHKFPTLTRESTEILGITCNKVILSNDKSEAGDAGELWIAYDFGIVMKDVKPEAGGSLIWKASSIDLSEPDASVFEIPQGYKIAGS